MHRRMGRAKRNPSVARDPGRTMGFASLYPSYALPILRASRLRQRLLQLVEAGPRIPAQPRRPLFRGGEVERIGPASGAQVLPERSEAHTSEHQSLMRISLDGFC